MAFQLLIFPFAALDKVEPAETQRQCFNDHDRYLALLLMRLIGRINQLIRRNGDKFPRFVVVDISESENAFAGRPAQAPGFSDDLVDNGPAAPHSKHINRLPTELIEQAIWHEQRRR